MKNLITLTNPSNTELQFQLNLFATLFAAFVEDDEVKILDALPLSEDTGNALVDLVEEIMENVPIAEILEKVPEATDVLISMGWELTVYDYFTNKVVEAVDETLEVYGRNVISVDYNEETEMIDINECHSSWSDVIEESIAYRDNVDTKRLIEELDERGIGYCGL